jgi:hypothetical protein
MIKNSADSADLFKVDPKFLENEERYADIKKEILGDSDDEDEESGSEEDSDDSDEEAIAPEKEGITDMTETNLINLRRTIYLTIMNSVRGSHRTRAHAADVIAQLRRSSTQAHEDQHPRRQRGESWLGIRSNIFTNP